MEKVFEYLCDLINTSNNRNEYEKILKELILEYSQLDISQTFYNDYSDKQIDVEHIIVMGVDMALTWNVTNILSHLNNENKTPETVLLEDISYLMGENEFDLLMNRISQEDEIEKFKCSPEPIMIMELNNYGNFKVFS